MLNRSEVTKMVNTTVLCLVAKFQDLYFSSKLLYRKNPQVNFLQIELT